MKNLKYVLVLISVFMLTGCMYAAIDVDIKNDDSGELVYTLAYEESYMKEQDISPEFDEDLANSIEGAKIEDVEFKKDDSNYIGKKITLNFKSLDEMNTAMEKLMQSDNADAKVLKGTRKKDEVTISMPADEQSYEESKMYLDYIDYTFKIKTEGKVISNNADEFDEKNNTLTWNIKTMLKDGISLKYDTSTSSNAWALYVIAALGLVVIGLFGFILIKRV